MPRPDSGRAARLRSDDVERRRATARDCREAAAAGEVLDWPTVAALAAVAARPDRRARAAARGALVESRSLWTTVDGERTRAWIEETDRVRELLERIAAADPAGGPEDPGDDRGRALLVDQLARAPRTSVLEVAGALDAALAHEEPAVRRILAGAVFANGAHPRGGSEGAHTLAGHADDPEPAVRAAVATALANGDVLGYDADETPAARAVVDLLEDPDPGVRRAAVEAVHEESPSDVREAHGPELADRLTRLIAVCTVDPDPRVAGRARDVVGELGGHPDWPEDLLATLTGAFPAGRGRRAVKPLRRTLEGRPEPLAPHVDELLAPGGSLADRVAGARVATVLLGSGADDAFPTDPAVDALVTAVAERAGEFGSRRELDSLETVAEHRPDRVLAELPVLYRALADGNRKTRQGARDVLGVLASERPAAVPGPVRALADADTDGYDDPLEPLLDSHPGFVRDRVAELVALAAEEPDVTDELYWRWWHAGLAEADPSVLDGALGRLAGMLRGGRRERETAGELLVWCAEDVDLGVLVGPLRSAVDDGPGETPSNVLWVLREAADGRPGLVEPVAPSVARWLTHHDGRRTAAGLLGAVPDDRLDDHGPLPAAARALADADALDPEGDDDPLAALAAVAPGECEAALEGIVDRFCDDATGDPEAVLDAVFAVREPAPGIAERAVRRLDDRLDAYGRRLDTAEPFLDRVEDDPDGTAAAGLGLLLSALEYSRGTFRSRVGPVLGSVAEARPGAAAGHVAAVVGRLTDEESTREGALALVRALLGTDPGEATLAALADALREEALATPPGDSSAATVLEALGALRETAPELAERAVSPLALEATVGVGGGPDALGPEVVLGGLRRAERLAGDPAGLDGLSLVVTGAVEGYSRDGFREALETRGASTAGSVSGRTDLLVVGENPGSAKRRAALEEGVPMVRAAALRELLGPD